MERIKSLNRYQKALLLLMMVMVIAFGVVYHVTISRVGFAYKDTILVPSRENGTTVYAGEIKGREASFTVSADKTVVFQYGDKTYGPYTAKKNPTAVPKDEDWAESMTGVELLEGDSVLFRGGVMKSREGYRLYDQDGTLHGPSITYVTGDGVVRDENGNVIDLMAPSAATVLELMGGPELTHKGEWLGWLGAAFVCALNAIFILFADELFRWNLAFQIRDPDSAEPSDWEIAGRYIGWTLLAIMALALFMMGLR